MSPAYVLLIVLAIAFAVAYAYYSASRWNDTLQEAARRLGLTFTKGGFLSSSRASGSYAGLSLTIDTFKRGSGKNSRLFTRVRALPTTIPASVLRPEGIGSSLKKVFVGEDLQTGDARFDETVVLRGDEAKLLSRLDAPRRQLVQRTLSGGVRLKGSDLYWEKRGYADSADVLVEVAERMVELEAALGSPGEPSPAAGLRGIALNDPVQAVRDRALQVLLEAYADRPEAREAALTVDGRFGAHVQLAAARALGPDGLPKLLELAEPSHARSVERAEALRLLARHHTHAPETAAALLAPLGVKDDPVLAVALQLAGELNIDVPLERLLNQTEHAYSEGRVMVVARLGDHDVDEARRALVGCLERDDDDAVLVATIEALGRIGAREEVEPILPFTKGLLTDGDVKRAARTAVECIQERLGAAGGGRLSIAATAASSDTGGLALANDGGGLSLEARNEPDEADQADVAEASERG